MFNKGLYHTWVPKLAQLVLIFATLIFILPAGGVYTANSAVMYADLGNLSEQLSFANNASTIGMVLAMPLIFSVINHFRLKEIVVTALVVVAVLSLVISQTESPYLIIGLSYIIGFLKYFALLVFILPVMRLVSPTGDRAQFYFFFYPFSICMGQLATYVTAKIAYVADWRHVYLWMAIGLLGCALAAIVTMHNKRGGKQVKMRGVDWKSALLLGTALSLLNYVFAFSKQQDWFNSGYIQIASVGFLILSVSFLYRQSVLDKPYVGLHFLRKRNVLTGILLMLLMGMYLATGVLQTAFTTVLGYDSPTTNVLNIAMVPGIIVGSLICRLAKKYSWAVRWPIFIAFICFQLSSIQMYFMIAPVIEIEFLLLPIFLKGVGMCILFIVVSLLVVDKLGPMDMLPVVSIFMAFRTFIGTSLFSAVFTWALYKLQLFQMSNLSSAVDGMNPFATLRGDTSLLYKSVSAQATLMAVKQLFGYVVLGGMIILVFVLLHPFNHLHHRKLILSRKRFRGESTKGYRKRGISIADIPAASVPAE